MGSVQVGGHTHEPVSPPRPRGRSHGCGTMNGEATLPYALDHKPPRHPGVPRARVEKPEAGTHHTDDAYLPSDT